MYDTPLALHCSVPESRVVTLPGRVNLGSRRASESEYQSVDYELHTARLLYSTVPQEVWADGLARSWAATSGLGGKGVDVMGTEEAVGGRTWHDMNFGRDGQRPSACTSLHACVCACMPVDARQGKARQGEREGKGKEAGAEANAGQRQRQRQRLRQRQPSSTGLHARLYAIGGGFVARDSRRSYLEMAVDG